MVGGKFDEKVLVMSMCAGDRKSYALLFHHYYKNLVLFAGTFIKDITVCEDIVQTIFIKLWTNRSEMADIASLRSYLLKSTQNACISYIRHLKTRSEYGEYKLSNSIDECYNSEEYILYTELSDKFEKALAILSPLHRRCLVMSRIEGRKYAEIADELDVSVRTVEVKISESLKQLKTALGEYFMIFF